MNATANKTIVGEEVSPAGRAGAVRRSASTQGSKIPALKFNKHQFKFSRE
jgi:hypothetical protein